MTKVHYHPEEGTPKFTRNLGHDFSTDGPTEVTDPKVLAKLRGNRFFEVEADPVVESARNESTGLRAVHRGRGVYGIVDGDVPLDQMTPMTKADADAFNAMSDEDKAAFVDKEPAATGTLAGAGTTT